MISFSYLDIIIILLFFLIIIIVGIYASLKTVNESDDYLLSGRKVGLLLFVLTNVATWYGGILGVGEFSYRYGLVSWLTQGLPYYLFALVFAFFLAEKIRDASLFTIPDKLEQIYGKKISLISAFLIFILVTPAPYVLMLGTLISLIFDISIVTSLFISVLVSSIYLFKGGYRSNIWTDAFSFFVMFIGFIIIAYVANSDFGGIDFLTKNLPEKHLSLIGGHSFTFVVVWFLIALWTFTDPGFHQRCYSAKNKFTAKWGIIISVFFWISFDFLTNTTGLFSKAILPDLENPVLAFPLLAEKILSPGLKGIFFAALIATILSTLNSFIFLSATTFSRDFVFRLRGNLNAKEIIQYTKYGIILAGFISIFISYFFTSVVEIWYLIGSLCIPSIILLVLSSYYPKAQISEKIALIEVIFSLMTSIIWYLLRNDFKSIAFIYEIEPMILGLITASVIHSFGMYERKQNYADYLNKSN